MNSRKIVDPFCFGTSSGLFVLTPLLLRFCSLFSDSILGHFDSKEQVADSQDGAPSLEELAAPPQPLRRIRRGLGGDDLDVTAAPSAFALPSDYLQHISFCFEFCSSSSSPRVRAQLLAVGHGLERILTNPLDCFYVAAFRPLLG